MRLRFKSVNGVFKPLLIGHHIGHLLFQSLFSVYGFIKLLIQVTFHISLCLLTSSHLVL